MNKYTTEYIDNVLTVRFDKISKGWEQWIMLSGDRHHDNQWCNRELESKQLNLARDREALIIDVGDLFCAMQGKYDPRKDQSDLRPEDKGTAYLDLIKEHAYEDYRKYKDNWLMIGRGNHDQNIKNRHGTDLIDGLVTLLRHDGSKVVAGGYGGWVRFMFTMRSTVNQSIRLKYHHGSGGSAPVTKGTIKTNRQAVYLPDADIVVNGHDHNNWILPLRRERLSGKGKIFSDYIWFARTPGYKDVYFGRLGAEGYENEKQQNPKPIGCVWLHLTYYDDKICHMMYSDLGT
jgi:hypothetical protein